MTINIPLWLCWTMIGIAPIVIALMAHGLLYVFTIFNWEKWDD